MRIDELDYELPPERIATRAVEPRDAARLMVVRRPRNRKDGSIAPGQPPEVVHARVADLPELGIVGAGDVMVVNRVRVAPARFEGVRAATGGRVRGLWLPPEGGPDSRDAGWRVMLEAKGTLTPGERVTLDAAASLGLVASLGGGVWRATLEAGGRTTAEVLAAVGAVPLPPYILKQRRARGEAVDQREDAERYNTVFAPAPGMDPSTALDGLRSESELGVAAPTAGLHFTAGLLARLDAAGVRRAAVTLCVGPGTFLPIRGDTVEGHTMHREWCSVPPDTVAALRAARAASRRVFVVGTTTVRTLESLPRDLPDGAGWAGDTDLYIHPQAVARGGFTWRYTDALMTNFHLPRSTLLAMVAALPGVGLDTLMRLYRTAIDEGYRFYSYGDAMVVV